MGLPQKEFIPQKRSILNAKKKKKKKKCSQGSKFFPFRVSIEPFSERRLKEIWKSCFPWTCIQSPLTMPQNMYCKLQGDFFQEKRKFRSCYKWWGRGSWRRYYTYYFQSPERYTFIGLIPSNMTYPIFFFYHFHSLRKFSRRRIHDISLFFAENRIWHFMQNVSIGDNLHEMSKPVFCEK